VREVKKSMDSEREGSREVEQSMDYEREGSTKVWIMTERGQEKYGL
jgi:hypothetical protein